MQRAGSMGDFLGSSLKIHMVKKLCIKDKVFFHQTVKLLT